MRWKVRTAALCAAWAVVCSAAAAGRLDPAMERQDASGDAQMVARWIADSGDTEGKPYLIVDKKAARVFVFDGQGRLAASAPVLLGSARGDHSVPGVGEHAQQGVVPEEERTTPAGRFETHPGRNLDGESIVWFDYEAALAIHRVRPGRSQATRKARLASGTPDERRVSAGCVVVPVAFFLDVIEPLFGRSKGVVYVLPETQGARELFTQIDAQAGAE
ncbi:L,D-transpeptidase [Ramlibacter humi]|uniref:L,D-transpeptidase n=1 Tax=Ramlibacter humi TaxID=2530451 RepID=A0A4Z0C0T1_9BURK|nr:L,D-transpeptidase [Ramlibacter humi]TFZ04138.1 L,D-transpeptidase [Ramlibacter humi]